MRKLIIDLVAFASLATAIFLFAGQLTAKPDRPDPTPKKEMPPPDVSGASNWGFVTQEGRQFSISGSLIWSGIGEIRKDGKVFVSWVHNDGRPAIAVYQIEGKDFLGHWGWCDEVSIDDAGELVGRRMSERIYKLAVQPDQ